MAGNASNQVEELGKLLGGPTESDTYGGRALTLRPFEFEILDQVLEIAEPFIADMSAEPSSRLKVFKRHKEQVFQLLALLTGEDLAWIRKLPAFDGLRLFSDLVEVNTDFFSQGLPQLAALLLLLPQPKAKSSSPEPTTRSAQPQGAVRGGDGASTGSSSSATGSASSSA